MRIAIVSDIHGNLAALRSVVEDLRKQSPDIVWCGGDIVWGAWPGEWANECLKIVRDSGWICVKGNTDVWVTGDPQTIEDPDKRRQNEDMARLHAIEPEDARWLLNLPLGHHGAGSILLVHGTPQSPFTAPEPEANAGEFEPYEGQASLVVYAHIHRTFLRRLNDGTIVANSGSVGLPLDGPSAAYALLDVRGPNWTFITRRVPFDTDLARREAERLRTPLADTFLARLGA